MDYKSTVPQLVVDYKPAGFCLGTFLVALIPISALVGYVYTKKRKKVA